MTRPMGPGQTYGTPAAEPQTYGTPDVEAARALMQAMGCSRDTDSAGESYGDCERHPRSAGYGGWTTDGCPEAARLARVAAAAALREAADDWAGGDWKTVNFNRAGRDEPPWARQARWLRERADRIEAAS